MSGSSNVFSLLCIVLCTCTQLRGQHEQLVQVGNHKLFVVDRGPERAKHTVIFESGGGGTSQDWANVIPLLSNDIRTIAYDRAGLGKSEAGPNPQTMAQNAFELNQLLKTLKVTGPYILVGHSIGGLIVRLYSMQYPEDVQALVLVDPTHESAVLGSMKYGGWVRLREKAEGKPIPLPQVDKAISAGYDSTADYLAEEFKNMYTSGSSKQLGKRPLIILSAGIRKQPPGTPDEQWKQISTERDQQVKSLTTLSENSQFIVDPKSGHLIQKDNPQIVADAILQVIRLLEVK